MRMANATVSSTTAASKLRTIETELSQRFPLQPKEDHHAAIDVKDLLFNLYRIGCLYVKRTLNSQLAHQSSEIQELITDCVSSLVALPQISPANGVLRWPLVITGLGAAVRTRVRSIARRLRKIHGTCKSDILRREAGSFYQRHGGRVALGESLKVWTYLVALNP